MTDVIIITITSTDINTDQKDLCSGFKALNNTLLHKHGKLLGTAINSTKSVFRRGSTHSIRGTNRDKSKPRFNTLNLCLLEATITSMIKQGNDFDSVWNCLSQSKLVYES